MLSLFVILVFDFGIYGDEVIILWEMVIFFLMEEIGS